jgi:sphinganine C4-monooxygenase
VDDHCGLWLPGNILQALFGNNSAYHDIHHQLYGNKYNFSQPFFCDVGQDIRNLYALLY